MTIPQDISDYHLKLDETDREICEVLAAEISRGLPEASCKVWHAHPVWFIDGNPIVGYHRLKHDLRLMFWSGQSFRTPGLAPEGSFEAAEIRYRSPDEVDTAVLASWLAESRDIQWDYKNIVKRKGELLRLK